MTEEMSLVPLPEEAEVVDEQNDDGPPIGPKPQPEAEKSSGCARLFQGPTVLSSLIRLLYMILVRMVTQGDNVKEALQYLRTNRPNERIIRWMNDE